MDSLHFVSSALVHSVQSNRPRARESPSQRHFERPPHQKSFRGNVRCAAPRPHERHNIDDSRASVRQLVASDEKGALGSPEAKT